MSAVEPCEKHEVSNCAFCRPTTASVQRRALERPLLGPWFEARWPGNCDGCDEEYQAGDQIRADGEGGYLYGTCGLTGAITE